MSQRWALLLVLAATVAGRGAPTGRLVLDPPWISHSLAVCGEPVEISALLRNTGDGDVDTINVNLFLPEGWSSDPVQIQIPKLAPFTTTRLRFRAMATVAGHGAGRLTVGAVHTSRPTCYAFPLASCQPLDTLPARYTLRERSMGEVTEDGTIYVATGSYLVFLPRCGDERGPGLIYSRQQHQWERVATFACLGRVTYLDRGPGGQQVVERWLFPSKTWIPRDPAGDYLLTLKDTWRDGLGRRWLAKAWLGPTSDPRVVKYTNVVWCNQPMTLLRLEGPMLNVGDGTFGTARAALLPPGNLAPGADGSLVTRRADSDEGVMAVQRPNGGVIGLLWDPRQYLMPRQATPDALFASPNSFFNRANHYLGLVAPTGCPPQAAPGSHSWRVPAKQPVYLRSELFVAADGTIDTARQAWRERFGAGSGHRTRPACGPTDDPQP